jgi:predicted molibdopterin-dependent oxidoreductase YjgC
MIQLVPNQSHLIERTPLVEFTFDGKVIAAHSGETVLSALLRAGIKNLRDAPTDGAPRGAFCCMGLCQECLVQIDGLNIESCRKTVTDGLIVRSIRRSNDG